MWKIRPTIAFSVLLLGLSSTRESRPLDEVKPSGSLRVAVYRDFRPFVEGPHDAVHGLEVNVAATIARHLGVKVGYMVLTAADSVDDDLRSDVWRGPILCGGVADLMLHVPVDPQLALRNDNVVIFLRPLYDRHNAHRPLVSRCLAK